MNVVSLIGNLTKDVTLGYAGDTAVAKFTVAVNDGYGEKQRTSFIPVTVFGKPAENADRYLGKGSKVAIVGRIQTGLYEKDGQKRYTTDVIANEVTYLSTKEENTAKTQNKASDGYTALSDEDVPF